MAKKIIVALLLIVGVFHLAWYYGSRIYQGRRLPSDTVIRQNQDHFIQRLHIVIDRNALEETFIDANGYRLHLMVFPRAENTPIIVMIPGTSVYALHYIQFMYDMYKQGYTVIGFDPRGHGQSSGPRGNYTISGIVDDALAVVKYARGRFGGKVVLAGSSQGGMAAFYAAARDDELAAAVCHNIADLNGRDNLVLSQIRPPLFLIPVCEYLMNIYANYSFPISLYLDLKKEKLPDGTDAAAFVKADPLATTWITFRALNSLLHTDMAKPVEKITVPIMLIHAGKDNIFPQAYVESIFNRLTCRKKYLLFKDREHLVMTNNVDEVVPPVTAWLKEVMP